MLLDISNPAHYDIATALRGPDDDVTIVKAICTAVIRYHVVDLTKLRPAISDGFEFELNGALVNSPDFVRARYTGNSGANPPKSWHHVYHAMRAFQALDVLYPDRGIKEYWTWAAMYLFNCDAHLSPLGQFPLDSGPFHTP